ncbi:hypothetical protein B7G86_01195 [Lacticaseibacillus rhamnosus]|nr:hypothetical protein BVH57_11720 [Lacticaseibacillus rhamnosus]OXT08333.1 hypothetical protein B7G86_01195 [Lacticaseibacillus rhamnosus]PCL26491.1 hypothetical protein CPZ15_04475 [Lacticaseibacillus rhamnosus]
MASDVMAGLWPLRLRSLHVDFCDCERVLEQSVNQPARVNLPLKNHHPKPNAPYIQTSKHLTWHSPFTALESALFLRYTKAY